MQLENFTIAWMGLVHQTSAGVQIQTFQSLQKVCVCMCNENMHVIVHNRRDQEWSQHYDGNRGMLVVVVVVVRRKERGVV